MRSRCPASILTHTRTRTHTHADTHGHAQAHPIPLQGAPSPLCAQRPGSHLHSLPRAAHGADSQPRARTTRSLRPRRPRARVTSELRARGVAHAWTPAFQHGATCHLPAPKGNRRHGGLPRPDSPRSPHCRSSVPRPGGRLLCGHSVRPWQGLQPLREKTDTWVSHVFVRPPLRQGPVLSAPAAFPTALQERVAPRPSSSRANARSASAASRGRSSWTRSRPARGGGRAGSPAAPPPKLPLFSWEPKPRRVQRAINLLRSDPTRKRVCQTTPPAVLRDTRPGPAHVRAQAAHSLTRTVHRPRLPRPRPRPEPRPGESRRGRTWTPGQLGPFQHESPPPGLRAECSGSCGREKLIRASPTLGAQPPPGRTPQPGHRVPARPPSARPPPLF